MAHKKASTKAPARKRMKPAAMAPKTSTKKKTVTQVPSREARKRPAKTTPTTSHAIASNAAAVYDPGEIVDAPEFHPLARAMGVLTTSTWDDGVRTFEDRVADFVFAYPPLAPVERSAGRLRRNANGSFAPGSEADRLERFKRHTWEFGTLHELLSRFGLKVKDAPRFQDHQLHLDPLREVAKRRNVRLRVLHGGVDVEAMNMDEAKAAYLDRQEKEAAAKEVRVARARMREESDAARRGDS